MGTSTGPKVNSVGRGGRASRRISRKWVKVKRTKGKTGKRYNLKKVGQKRSIRKYG